MSAAPVAVRHLVIRGHVQGVGYRAWVERMALTRDIQGWVRNRIDGSVEAVFAGPPEDVAAMIALCRRGPAGARVAAIDERDASPDLLKRCYAGERFSVLPTS
jgi:acylphosphatase